MAPARKRTQPSKPVPQPARTLPTAPENVIQAARQVTGDEQAERDKAAAVLADWASMLAPDSDDFEIGLPAAGVRIDVEKSVPGPIRAFVERSLEAYGEEILGSGGRVLPEGTPKYQQKTFADSTTAAEFIRLCHYYAKYRPAALGGRITVRATQLVSEPQTVRLAAQPFVPRPRKVKVA